MTQAEQPGRYMWFGVALLAYAALASVPARAIDGQDQKTLADFAAAAGAGSVPEPAAGGFVLLAGGLMMRRAGTSKRRGRKTSPLQIFIQIY